jgi:hypothetical protein
LTVRPRLIVPAVVLVLAAGTWAARFDIVLAAR